MKIFLTGASGFVGGAATRRLAASHGVLAMARSEAAAGKVRALGAQPVRCDLATVAAEHMAGCDCVVHCAAYAEEWGAEADYYNANVVGTQRMLDAARAAGVRRFVHIGTEAALFGGQHMQNVDETYPYADPSPYPYSRTKAEAERRVLAANGPDFVTLSLRPRLIWGPGDVTVLPAILEQARAGRFAWIGGGPYLTSTAHIDNVVHAIELALAHGVGGQAYFIADAGTLPMREFVTRYVATQGVTLPDTQVPRAVARAAASGIQAIWNALGLRSRPPLVPFSVGMMSVHCTVDTRKAERDLGYQPLITVDEGLRTMPRMSGATT